MTRVVLAVASMASAISNSAAAQDIGENALFVAEAAQRCEQATDFDTALAEADSMSLRLTMMLDQVGTQGTPNLDMRMLDLSSSLLGLCMQRVERLAPSSSD